VLAKWEKDKDEVQKFWNLAIVWWDILANILLFVTTVILTLTQKEVKYFGFSFGGYWSFWVKSVGLGVYYILIFIYHVSKE